MSRKGSSYKTNAPFEKCVICGKDDVVNLWIDGKIDSGFKGSFEDLVETIEYFFNEVKGDPNSYKKLYTIFYDEDGEQFKVRGL